MVRESYSADKQKTDYYFHPWAYFVIRPISFYISALCVNSGLSAMSVTYIGAGILLLGTLLMVLPIGYPFFLFSGALLMNVWYLLDFVDGNIARYSSAASERGALIDSTIGHFYLLLTPIAVGAAVAVHYEFEFNTASFIYAGLTIALLDASRSALSKTLSLKFNGETNTKIKQVGRLIHAGYAVNSLQAPALLIFAVFSMLHLWLAVYLFLAVGSWLATLIKIFRKT